MKTKYLEPQVRVITVTLRKNVLLNGSGTESNLTRNTEYSEWEEEEFWN